MLLMLFNSEGSIFSQPALRIQLKLIRLRRQVDTVKDRRSSFGGGEKLSSSSTIEEDNVEEVGDEVKRVDAVDTFDAVDLISGDSLLIFTELVASAVVAVLVKASGLAFKDKLSLGSD